MGQADPRRARSVRLAVALGMLIVLAARGRADEPQLNAQQQARMRQANQAMAEADGYFQKGQYRDAVPLLIENLKICREVLGAQHHETLNSMNNLAVLRRKLGQYAEARKLMEETLAVQRQILAADDPRLSNSLTNLGTQLQEAGEFDGARKCYEEALALEQRYRGDNHRQTAIAVAKMGELLQTIGNYRQALAYLQRAYAINLKLYGEQHATTAVALNDLGTLASAMGDYAAARTYFERAGAIQFEVLGGQHPDLAASTNNLADVFLNLRDYENSLFYYEYALKIYQANLGDKHPDVALVINNIGVTYARQGDVRQARQYLGKALAMRRELLGDQHVVVATSMCYLAELLHGEGDDAQAKRYFDQSLAIYQKTFGEQSQQVATTRFHLGSILIDQGKFDEAQGELERTLAAYRMLLDDSHPFVAQVLKVLSDLHARQGQWTEASRRLEENRRVVRRHAASTLAGLSEQEQLHYLAAEHTGPLHGGLSWALARPEDDALVNPSAGWLLNGKALTQEAVAQRTLLARDSRDPQIGETARQLLEVREQLASRNFRKPIAGDAAAAKQETERLQLLEGVLSRRLAAAGDGGSRIDPWVELAVLRARLETHSAFITIARFPIYHTGAKRGEPQWKADRYAAWLVPPAGAGQVKVIDLGPADAIEALVEKSRAAIDDLKIYTEQGEIEGEKAAREPLAALSQIIFEPIRRSLPEGTTRLLLSPDASLWIVPWSALRLPDGKYAVEQYEFQYLISGREIVQDKTSAAKARPVIMADPDYDLGRKESLAATQAVLRRSIKPDDRAPRSVDTRPRLPRVSRLPGTAAEAASIAPKLAAFAGADPLVYTNQYALEGVFKVLARPRTIVLSTHGFVLQDQKVAPNSRGLTDLDEAGGVTLVDNASPIENLLARCGLLLAGCNSREPGTGDDGVLTGLEIVGTDLRGTELVVLSACETGLGHIQQGEGVSGLRQAFQLAGAQTVAATLWKIPDSDTALLMSDFFTELANGASKSAALRNAQLARIKARREQNKAAHPFFWAAFTVTGQ